MRLYTYGIGRYGIVYQTSASILKYKWLYYHSVMCVWIELKLVWKFDVFGVKKIHLCLNTQDKILSTYIYVNQNSRYLPKLLLLRILYTTEVGLMATHIIHRRSDSPCCSDGNFKAASHNL